MAVSKSAKIATVRREYTAAKRARKILGSKALGKPKTSKIQKEYKAATRVYKTIGKTLGSLTGRKPRQSV
jgi:hypothetical protein